MKKFSELEVGDEFYSTCKISDNELDNYLSFSGIKNIIYDNSNSKQENKMVSGRAILAKMEGEFTKLDSIYGNLIIFYGMDGDPQLGNRQTRFLKPVFTNEELKIKFRIVDKKDLNEEFGLISVDFEGINKDGKTTVVSKRNLYQIKKESPFHQK